jgi:hypothetical protein
MVVVARNRLETAMKPEIASRGSGFAASRETGIQPGSVTTPRWVRGS